MKWYNIIMFKYRPRGQFIQVPETVVAFLVEIRPALLSKIYLYLYNNSIGAGRTKTEYLSGRKLSENLNVKKTQTYDMLKELQHMGAIEVAHQRRGLGTVYEVHLPFKYSNMWYFTTAAECSYLWQKGEKPIPKRYNQSTLFRY